MKGFLTAIFSISFALCFSQEYLTIEGGAISQGDRFIAHNIQWSAGFVSFPKGNNELKYKQTNWGYGFDFTAKQYNLGKSLEFDIAAYHWLLDPVWAYAGGMYQGDAAQIRPMAGLKGFVYLDSVIFLTADIKAAFKGDTDVYYSAGVMINVTPCKCKRKKRFF